MPTGLQLHDSRLTRLDFVEGAATLHFSHAYILSWHAHPGADADTASTEEAQLVIAEARVEGELPPLPNTISDGYLEVGGIRLEPLVLPFHRKAAGRLWLRFADGSELTLTGGRSEVLLAGERKWLQDLS